MDHISVRDGFAAGRLSGRGCGAGASGFHSGVYSVDSVPAGDWALAPVVAGAALASVAVSVVVGMALVPGQRHGWMPRSSTWSGSRQG